METMNVAIDNMIAAIETMDPEILAGGILFFAGLMAAIVAYGVIRYLMTAIGYSKMYRKAGVAGYKAFIPVYNTYNNYKISLNGKMFFLYAALAIASTILGVYTEGVMAIVASLVSIGVIYIVMKQHINMAKLFGKGFGTAIALIFFPGITSLILGMGDAEFRNEIHEND